MEGGDRAGWNLPLKLLANSGVAHSEGQGIRYLKPSPESGGHAAPNWKLPLTDILCCVPWLPGAQHAAAFANLNPSTFLPSPSAELPSEDRVVTT